AALGKAGFLQPLAKRGYSGHVAGVCPAIDYPDQRHRLLRARSERQCRCASNRRDEIAPPHSITSSAVASNCGWNSKPRVFAVLRLMTNSNLADCITGILAGFSPFRMR